MSLDASLHVVIPISEIDAALESLRSLGKCVVDEQEREEYGVLFQLQMKMAAGKSAKNWYADVEASAGKIHAEIVFVCDGKDAMELVSQESSILHQIAAGLKPHRVVCGQIVVEDEQHLLTGNLTLAKGRFGWPDISTGGEGADQMAAAYKSRNSR